MRFFLRILLFSALVYSGLCCGRGRKRKPNGQPQQPNQPQDAVSALLGPNVKTTPYVPAGDSPQSSCDALSCNFESSCCWTNAQPPADQLNWIQATGQPDVDKLQKIFGTTSTPDGSYLLTASATPGSSSQSAQFYSCPISCSSSDITVKLKSWQTSSVQLQVCTETDPNGPPQNCQTLPNDSGNQHAITVPKGENQRVVIQAVGFTDPGGSGAMISNLEVSCDPCVSTTTAGPIVTEPPTTPVPSTICHDIPCDFEDGSLCKYQSAGTAESNFANQQVPYNNRLTGIPKPHQGQHFAGSYMKAKQGQKSTLTAKTNFDQAYVIRCQYFDDTDGLSFKGCCNDENNCPFDSKNAVEVKDYQTWRTASFSCPVGTTAVVFVGDNTQGINEGAAAVDDIQVLQPAEPADSASQPACGGGGGGGGRRRNHRHQRSLIYS